MTPKLYEIVWTERVICTAYVRADSDAEARRQWREHNLVSDIHKSNDGSELHAVQEMPAFHDRLCCCPTCEENLVTDVVLCPCCGEIGYDDPADCTFCADQEHVHG